MIIIAAATEKKFRDGVKEGEALVELCNTKISCLKCDLEHDSNNCLVSGTRNVFLHTLHHGSFDAAVKDFI